MIATIVTIAKVVVFTEVVVVVVVVVLVEVVEVAAEFVEEVMVFVVVVVVEIVEVAAIDPGESINMRSRFALEFTQETPQSICSKDVALSNIWDMSMTAETSHADRSWLKHRAR